MSIHDNPRANISVRPFPQISQRQQKCDAREHDACPVHRLSIRYWVAVREHVLDVEHEDICTRRAHHEVADNAWHPERSWSNVLPSCEDMRENGGAVRHGREDDEARYESIEGRGRADVYASQDRSTDGAEDLSVEWITPSGRNVTDEGRKWCGIIATKSPEHAACGNPRSWDGDDDVDAEEEEKSKGPCVGSDGLLEHCSEGEGGDVGGVHIIERGHAVKLVVIVSWSSFPRYCKPLTIAM